jgi:hypothetical protein
MPMMLPTSTSEKKERKERNGERTEMNESALSYHRQLPFSSCFGKEGRTTKNTNTTGLKLQGSSSSLLYRYVEKTYDEYPEEQIKIT